MSTYIDGNMADDGCVVGQANVARLAVSRAALAIADAVGAGGRRCVRIDDEGTRDIDLDAARPGDCAVDFLGRCNGADAVIVGCHGVHGVNDNGRRRRRHAGGEYPRYAPRGSYCAVAVVIIRGMAGAKESWTSGVMLTRQLGGLGGADGQMDKGWASLSRCRWGSPAVIDCPAPCAGQGEVSILGQQPP